MKKKLSKEITKKNKAISYRDSKIEKLEVENRNLNIQIEQLIAKYEDKLMASKKFQIEKFIPSSEKLKDTFNDNTEWFGLEEEQEDTEEE